MRIWILAACLLSSACARGPASTNDLAQQNSSIVAPLLAATLRTAEDAAVTDSESFAQKTSGSYATAMLAGDCRRLVIAGRDVSAGCKGRVMNTNYYSGRSGFTFGTDREVVTFSGMDTPAVGDRAFTRLDKVIITRIGGMRPTPREVRATGQCHYSNPHAGRSYVRCSARTAEREFSVDFLSNGQPPETL
jgi:hypothetical protein